MSYRFHPRKPPSEEKRRVAREQIVSALDAITQQDEPEATHQVRKHCKKMRALMRLVQKTDDSTEQLYRFENAHYRGIAEILSGSRDAVSLYDALVKQLGREHFPATATLLEARIDTSGAQEALQQAEELLREGQQHIDNWDLADLGKKDLIRGYARSHRRTFNAANEALEDYDIVRMHTLRKRVKDQWYHTRLLQPLKPKKIGNRRAHLKTLASALGDWRDLRLLCDFLADRGEELNGELIPLLDSAQQRLEELRAVIGRECDRLFARKSWQRQCQVAKAAAR
ncbi:CHAD domain-containing protein [Microbulbifer pacificus]|uniref:CHAD domain-containing protein n=1 Tax=Microbulbifer pacificus TaxID=407164 RepID=A0AAU0MUM1_9GAMM|nr:CHAD domain-containing protein [Microbulbifer pacificus]WOX04118.1 CHAD domain-containing protein [Microbulbifer pacificus]